MAGSADGHVSRKSVMQLSSAATAGRSTASWAQQWWGLAVCVGRCEACFAKFQEQDVTAPISAALPLSAVISLFNLIHSLIS